MTRPVVVDTNVLVSGLLTRDERAPTARIVVSMLRGEFHLLLSMDLLKEYREVLLRPAIRSRHGLTEEEVEDLLADIAVVAAFPSVADTTVAERRDDLHVRLLAGARAGTVLVTGDETLRASPLADVKVLSPREFLGRPRQ